MPIVIRLKLFILALSIAFAGFAGPAVAIAGDGEGRANLATMQNCEMACCDMACCIADYCDDAVTCQNCCLFLTKSDLPSIGLDEKGPNYGADLPAWARQYSHALDPPPPRMETY